MNFNKEALHKTYLDLWEIFLNTTILKLCQIQPLQYIKSQYNRQV